MQVVLTRIEADVAGTRRQAAVRGDGPVRLGPLEVDLLGDDDEVRWAVANRSEADVAVRSVALVLTVADVAAPLRMFRNGYQSWSPTAVATLGVDVDPSTHADLEFLQAAHHADQRTVTTPGELRSE